MRSVIGLISILVTAAIGMGIYTTMLKESAPGPGMVITQSISTTGVQSDLVSIAQAERAYYLQNNSYTDLETLSSSGTMNIARTGRDGYTYSVDSSDSSFTVTARYTAAPPEMPAGVAPPHFPTFTVDQTMEVHQGD